LKPGNSTASSRTDGNKPATRPVPAGETVVLLHGLGMGSWAMKRFETALRHDGYRVLNLSYPSRRLPLEELASRWLPEALRARGVSTATHLHFVTHSMGGIVLRAYLRAHPDVLAGHVVMLAPPNAGSEVVDRLSAFPPFRWFTGVNGNRLGTAANAFPRALGPWQARPEPVERAGRLGIIAGDRTFNPLFWAWIKGPNDGKVSVASAQLAGMSDFLVLHHSHTWLQWRREAIHQVRTFLRTGRFDHAARPGILSPNK
jgi:pimeloyl-ACP methyl ester carboxylesterase